MATTEIDAVALVRRIRDAHHEELKDATSAERIRFFRERAERLHRSLENAESTRRSGETR